jgi:hypothetical protein
MGTALRAWPVLLIAAGLGFLAARGTFWSYTIEEEHKASFRTAERPVVVVDVFNGSIKVNRSRGHDLHARLVKRAVGDDKADAEKVLEKIQVRMEQQGENRFVFTGRYADHFGGGNNGVFAELDVPVDAELQLTSSNARVEVSGIQGAIRVTTTNGEVRVQGNREPVQVQTSNASITIQEGQGRFDLKTTNSPISIKALQAAVQAKTTNSGITFQGSLREGDHTLITTNGRIEVKLPPESQFYVDASTSNSRVTSDFEIIGWNAPRGKKPPKLQGNTAGGRPRFNMKLQTSNGGIALKHGTANVEED